MSDRPPEDAGPSDVPEDPHTAADAAAVSRLLGELRTEEPMPASVAARLDAALADLTRERAAGTGDDPVVSMAHRRRRVRTLLVAAAAAVIVGVGVGVVHDHTVITSQDSAGSAADTAAAGGSADEAGPGMSAGAIASDAAAPAHLSHALGQPIRLTSGRFGAQVRRLQHSPRLEQRGPADGSSCVATGFHGVVLVPVRYEGDPGLLVFRRPTGETQVVDLFLCGRPEPVRSVTLPRR